MDAGPDPSRPAELDKDKAALERLLTAATLDLSGSYKDAYEQCKALEDLSLPCIPAVRTHCCPP